LSKHWPEHRSHGELQAGVQVPARHCVVPFVGAVQTEPQVLQLFSSVWRSTHLVPHLFGVGALQVKPQVPLLHVASPDPAVGPWQLVQLAPQCVGSLPMS
jgi:hypothetical protein